MLNVKVITRHITHILRHPLGFDFILRQYAHRAHTETLSRISSDFILE